MPTPPPSQTRRNIGFFLTGAPAGDQAFVFGLRPEDLSHHEPSRLTVQQSLGGAWADAFDRGVSRINIAGTTGWRGTLTQSGEDLFFGLRETVFVGWHQARQDAIASGNDPDIVQLFFTDSLDDISVLVAPNDFQLHRSKTSPLLIRYKIDLTVLDDAAAPAFFDDSLALALADPGRWVNALAGLRTSLFLIPIYLQQAIQVFSDASFFVQSFVGATLGLVTGVIKTAQATAGQFLGAAAALLSVGRQIAFAGEQAFAVLAESVALTMAEAAAVGRLASSFGDIGCSLANGFNLIGQFPDWEAFGGASHCSSTAGGDPISVFTAQDITPFSYAVRTDVLFVTVTPDAQAALDSLSGDPLLLIDQSDAIYDLMRRTSNGVAVGDL